MADQATFVADAEPFMGSLFSTAMRMTGNKQDAEDLVQDTYLRAYRSYGSFSEGTNLRAWLFRIMTNAHINRYRSKQRRPDETELDDLDDMYLYRRLNGPTSHGRSAEDELMDLFSEAEVVAAVEALLRTIGWPCSWPMSRALPTRRSPRSSTSRSARS
ncbi:MAG: sigma-70 family RNA polymerase sigma factor [Acidimicrobiales bacterium]